jgi:Ca2+-binding RTX toxin-like protein
MAKFRYTTYLGKYGELSSDYDEQTLKLGKGHTSKEATYTDSHGGAHIVLEGSGFTYAGSRITGGTIDTITFEDKQGHAMVTMTDGHFNARQFAKMLTGTNGVEIFVDQIKSGKDTFVGSNLSDYLTGGMDNDKIDGGTGNDVLYGGRGNDVLHGGAGSDTFLFSPDKDVVNDFDANGGGTRQDYINADFHDVTITTSGHNVVLENTNGYILTLLGVDRGDISAADFHLL